MGGLILLLNAKKQDARASCFWVFPTNGTNVHTPMEPNNLHTRAQNQTTCTRARNQTTLWTCKAFKRVFKGIFQKGVYGWLPLNGFSKAFKKSLVISTAGLGVIFTAGLGVILYCWPWCDFYCWPWYYFYCWPWCEFYCLEAWPYKALYGLSRPFNI